MNYQQFINQTVIDYRGQEGSVISLDSDKVVVQHSNEQVTYKTDIAFKNKALIFKNDELNNLINEDLDDREKASIIHQEKIDKINKEAIKRNKMASDKYIELEKKEKALKWLFGDDFVYPPFEALKKKFPHAKRKKTWIELWLEDMKGSIARTYPKKKDQNVQS